MPNNPRRVFLSAILLLAYHPCFAAEMNVQLTTNDGSTKMSIQNSGAAEVASIDSQGNASFNRVTGSGSGLTSLNASGLASGVVPDARLDSSSVTLQGNTFNTPNALVQLDGTSRLPAVDGSLITNVDGANISKVIKLQNILQSGATFYVSSGTAANFNTTSLKFADGTTQTTAGGSGGTNFIQNTSVLQSGATFFTSSGTVNNLIIGTSISLPAGSVALPALTNGILQSGVVASSISANSVYPAALQSAAYPAITGVGTQGQALNMNSNVINNVASPVSVTDAVNKQYVDSFSKGSTNYIQVTNVLQSGATFYVSSGTVSGQFNARHFAGLSSVPTIAVGVGAGTVATASLTGTDAAGEITLNAGAAPVVSSTIVIITFNTAYTSSAYIVFSPSNNQSALLSAANGIYVTSTPTTFSLVSGVTAITASVTYKWHYHVIQ